MAIHLNWTKPVRLLRHALQCWAWAVDCTEEKEEYTAAQIPFNADSKPSKAGANWHQWTLKQVLIPIALLFFSFGWCEWEQTRVQTNRKSYRYDTKPVQKLLQSNKHYEDKGDLCLPRNKSFAGLNGSRDWYWVWKLFTS